MSGDCGCNGPSTPAVATSGCGCAGSCGTDVALAGAGFVRPRFFGGMLLTEDDLQAAIDYTVAKRKLTNRHVIGAGVICGLDVTKHACDTGVVVVSPGYAIECCGNDILVSCPEEVNIIDLVRDLRRRTGADCGEPCDKHPRHEYHLYVRYAETPTAPVAPYAPDDCATGECEFSRISEGYRFELRCDGPEDMATLLDALKACGPDEGVMTRATEQMTTALSLISHRAEIAERQAAGDPAPAEPAASEFTQALVNPDKPAEGVKLAEGALLVGRSLASLARDATAALTTPSTWLANRRGLIELTQNLAEQLRTSEELKAQPPEERARIIRTLDAAKDPSALATLSAADRAWLEVGTTADEAERRFVAGAESVRGTVLRQLADRGETGSADYHAVSAMRFSSLTDASEQDVARLARVVLASVHACACSAWNPPCPTCTDDAVALAKVRVDGCDVVEVCALDRRWVPSPRAVSYWFPMVETMRTQLESCCGKHEESGTSVDTSASNLVRTAIGQLDVELTQTRGKPDAQRSVEQLEQQVKALTKRIDELTAKQGAPA